MKDRKKILIMAEDASPDSLSLCGAGSRLDTAMETCVLLVTRNIAENFFTAGADKVWAFDIPELPHDDLAIAQALAAFTGKLSPEIILINATIRGRAIAPALAAELKTGLTADCCALSIEDDGLLVQIRPAYGSQLSAEIVSEKTRPQMASVRPGIFPSALLDETRRGRVEYIPFDRICRVNSLSFCAFTGIAHLRNADIILAGGKGIGSRADFTRLEEIAAEIGAGLAASRAAVDAGFAPYSCQVGQTGVVVRPKLYIACGISGSVQHLAGMSGSEKIVAININPNAPIFRYADYGIIGDWQEVLEIFLEEHKSLRTEVMEHELQEIV